MTGKVESAIGTMLSSHALKQKGEEKQREADLVKAQSAELAEAERLERAAHEHRVRAVGQGAHPDNMHLSGGGGMGTL